MRVRLKGINSRRKKLADGRIVTYYWAWKGGPPLRGAFGSPEFIASYNEAIASRPKKPLASRKMLGGVVDAYLDSEAFLGLAERTRADYSGHAKMIAREFGDMPIAALADRGARAEFLDWRDKLAKASRRQADYAWTVLARVLSWAMDRELVDANPCEKGGRLYSGSRADKVWREEDEAAFRARAHPCLSLALTLALWTGQRQGDLLKLTWFAYDGAYIRLRQGKTGARVVIPVGGPLKAALDATKRVNERILVNQSGEPWTEDGFRVSWRKACARAGVAGVTFHDLRGTAVLRLFLAGCTEAEIATITGHTLRDVRSILDANYFHRDVALAESGIRKLENARGTKSPD
jgi:integrase